MFLRLTVITILSAVNCSGSVQLKDNRTCPFWHIPEEQNGTITCKCGDLLYNFVNCFSEKEFKLVEVPFCFCMSYLDTIDVIGNCPYTCQATIGVNRVNSTSCRAWLHRTGVMCGKCEDGFAPPVYFFGCVNCTNYNDYKYNWLKYIAVAYLPLTVFYFVVILARIRATSAELNALVYIVQISAFSAIIKNGNNYKRQHYTANVQASLKTALRGFFNLDFIRGVYSPFCLSPHLSTIQVTALDYLIGVYPLLLILVTYSLVKLHDNFSVVVRLWKPFNRCFALLDRQWNMKGSLVDAFATFLLLSYVKMLNVSLDLLTPVSVYGTNGAALNTSYVYIDGTVEYFGEEHRPYGILAIVALLVFNVLPVVLLCLYPCPCFQRCLNRTGLRCQALHIFMDSFQGCYREELRYCKYFSAVYLLARIGTIACFSLTLSYRAFWIVEVFFLIFPAMLVAVIRPYRDNKYNIIDIVLLLSTVGSTTKKHYRLNTTNIYKYKFYPLMYFISVLIPSAYALALVVHKLLPKCLVKRIKGFVQKIRRKQDHHVADPWPARLDDAHGEHTPLLSAAQ